MFVSFLCYCFTSFYGPHTHPHTCVHTHAHTHTQPAAALCLGQGGQLHLQLDSHLKEAPSWQVSQAQQKWLWPHPGSASTHKAGPWSFGLIAL